MDRIEKDRLFSMPTQPCNHKSGLTLLSAQCRYGRRLVTLTLLIMISLIASGTLAACSGNSPAATEATSLYVTASASDPIKETTVPTTSDPKDLPSVKYTFDLTADRIIDPDYQLAFISNEDKAVIFGGELSPYTIEGKFPCSEVDSMWSPATSMQFHLTSAIYRFAYSIDKTSIAFIVRKENPINYVLMYFDGSEASEVSQDSEYFCISSDGSSVAYILDDKLYVWNVSSKESTLITADATSSFVLSPNGKYVGYAKGENYTCYIAPVNGDSLEIGSSCYPVALTDDGSVLYYYDDSNDKTAFCVFSSGSPQILNNDAVIMQWEYPYGSGLVFNRDCTQVVYRSGEEYFFSMNGGKPVKATGGRVVDKNHKYYVDDSFVRMQIAGNNYTAPYYVENKNLCNLLFQNGDALTFFDENFEVITFPISEYSEGVLSGDGKALSYLAYDDTVNPPIKTGIFLTDYTDPKSSIFKLTDFHTWFFLMTGNDNFYFLNDVEQLFVIRGDDEPVKIDTYVYDFNVMTVGNTSYIYYLKDQTSDYTYTLYRIDDVPGAKPVMIDTGVCDMDICDAGLVYYKNFILYDPGSWSKDIYFAADGLSGEFIITMDYYVY